MIQHSKRFGARGAKGFTLAEVAVTIAIVGLALAWMLQTLSSSKLTAAYSRNLKLARELAVYTLGQIESGLYVEELDQDRIEGSYADEGYPDFHFEAVLGDESLSPNRDDARAFDNWRHEQSVKERNASREEEEETEQPYEKVQVRVTFPKIGDLKNDYIIERWLPWKQVHPDEAGAEGEESGAGAASGGAGTGSGGR
jgi:prepilin-type N-terminal cleavage/methylation domain-containing protein